MAFIKAAVLCSTLLLLGAGPVSAQSTTGTISGRVTDSQELPLAGVTVTVESPNLQGTRTAITSNNGDYILTLLPSGSYVVAFELSGFQRQVRTLDLAPTQVFPVDVTLGPALSETVDVVGRTANVLTRTAQVATNFPQSLVAELPTTRDVTASLLLAPSVHATGPNGGYSIAGSMSYENLFLVNGVTVNENLRGQPHELYIEDAIQETTVASAGISAEYGRFGGGVVNIVTKSGGNTFGGSFRDTLTNDDWRSLTPFPGDSKIDRTVPTYEYTAGGPGWRDHLWFFTAGRLQSIEERRALVVTNLPYDYSSSMQRYEGKATFSANPNHRFEGAHIRSHENQTNATFSTQTSMDLRSLYDPKRVMDLTSVSYHGILSSNFFVEGRLSARNETLRNIGARSTDLVEGTLLLDLSRQGRRYWAPTFCGVCDPEERDNQNIFAKASYFVSSPDFGSHSLVFGYDGFNDRRFANNRQSGSDYRIYGTGAILSGTTLTPVFISGQTVIQWNPIVVETEGTNFRMHSVFFNDNWRVNDRITANVGVRFDRNYGKNGAGQLVTDDHAWSPRLGVIWDPRGDGQWSLSGSFARYVAAIAGSIADASSPAGNSDNYPYVYAGPSINANGVVETPTPDAIRQVFDWFFANGGTDRPLGSGPFPIGITVRGVTPVIQDALTSPNVIEYAGGAARQFGGRAAVRADVIYRDYTDFYASATSTETGQVTDRLNRTFDLTVIRNSEQLRRRYAGMSAQATYRPNSDLELGATYTLSRTWGNFDGESVAAGPTTDGSLQYPEYKSPTWSMPDGDLAIDQRHRARLWANYQVPGLTGLSVSALQILESGVPYGAFSPNGVASRNYVSNPGYVSPPGSVPYYFTARDAFRTEGQKRTDLALNYRFAPGGLGLQLFGQLQIINLFNQSQLCGCGQAAAQNGGVVNAARIDQNVATAVSAPTYAAFDPFTETPVQGVHWNYGPTFGTALNRFAYTTPRTLRVSFGIRF